MEEQQQEAKDFDSVADKLLNEAEMQAPAESSTENKAEDGQVADKTSGADPAKTEQVKAVESDTSLSVEEKLAKVKEILGEDEKAIDAYIKQKGYHNDPAWQKQRELIEKLKKEGSALSEEDKAALAEFKQLRTSPNYIRENMKAQGYKDEAIDNKLRELGHTVPEKQEDDVSLVIEKLGIKADEVSPDVRANISDVVKIANILINDRLGKTLPKELKPIQEHISSMAQKEGAVKSVSIMRETVKTEGILDFEKDIEPELNKYMDANPDATQQDVAEQFKVINHKLSLDRVKLGNKKEDRDDKRNNLRQNIPVSGGKPSAQRTGNFDKDADSFLDAVNA
jgi:hypothetical protein